MSLLCNERTMRQSHGTAVAIMIPMQPQTMPPQPPNRGHHESPERDPDGVPHDIVGTTAFIAVLLAILLGGAWKLVGPIAAGIVTFLVGIYAIFRMSRRSNRERHEIEEESPPQVDGEHEDHRP